MAVPSGQFRLPSAVSHKRAAAAAPELNDAMFTKVGDAYEYLHNEGILKIKEPLPEQVLFDSNSSNNCSNSSNNERRTKAS